MTKEELKQRIDIMLSESDRKVANILLEHTLSQMQIYYQSKIEELKQQLIDEKADEVNRYEIALTVCEREKFTLIDDTFFAMNISDVSSSEYFVTEESVFFPIWIEADDKYIEQYETTGVKGVVSTNVGEFETIFKLIKNFTYLDILQKCKLAFAQNGLGWKDVNEAYLHKFYYLEVNLFNIQNIQEIIGYSIDDSEFGKKIRKNIIPLWNVRYVTMQANDFPAMQENKINYRYDFAVTRQTELLLDTPEAMNGYYERYIDRFSFFTDKNDYQQFSFWQIWSKDFHTIQNDYLILTNGVNRKMWSCQNSVEIVHSAWELARRVQSLSISDKIAYQGYQILEAYDKESDYVIAEEKSNVLHLCSQRSFLELIIENVNLPKYLYRNTVQYIINAIQSEFREYTVICKVQI